MAEVFQEMQGYFRKYKLFQFAGAGARPLYGMMAHGTFSTKDGQ